MLQNANISCALIEGEQGILQIIVEDPQGAEQARILHSKIVAVYARRVDATLGKNLKRRNTVGSYVLMIAASVLVASLVGLEWCGR